MKARFLFLPALSAFIAVVSAADGKCVLEIHVFPEPLDVARRAVGQGDALFSIDCE